MTTPAPPFDPVTVTMAEALLACSCGMNRHPVEDMPTPYTLEWHIAHRTRHLAAFPELDDASRGNLDLLVQWATTDDLP